jgi:hypothetical protein
VVVITIDNPAPVSAASIVIRVAITRIEANLIARHMPIVDPGLGIIGKPNAIANVDIPNFDIPRTDLVVVDSSVIARRERSIFGGWSEWSIFASTRKIAIGRRIHAIG